MPEPLPDLTTPVPVGATYTSRPTTITAGQWTGGNIQELWGWVGADNLYGPLPEEDRRSARPAKLYVAANAAWLDLEIGEWIIKDDLGFYPCKDSVFRKKYQRLIGHTSWDADRIKSYSKAPHILIQNGQDVG